MRQSIIELRDVLDSGELTSEALVERMLAKAQEPDGEGPRVYLRLYGDSALAQARAYDACRQAAMLPSQFGPLAGIPISIKDLFDVAGEVTSAGSVVLRDNPPALRDAPIVERLRRAGAIFTGRTNMTE